MKYLAAALAAFAMTTVMASADSVRIGEIEVHKAWARASIGISRPGAAYFTLRNLGNDTVTLTGITTVIAAMSMLHQTTTTDGIASMSHLSTLEIEPGTSVALAPGGMHVMLMDLMSPLDEGGSFPMTLTFDSGDEVTVDVPVLGIGAKGPED